MGEKITHYIMSASFLCFLLCSIAAVILQNKYYGNDKGRIHLALGLTFGLLIKQSINKYF